MIRGGHSVAAAARAAHINPRTAYRLRAQEEAFARAFEHARRAARQDREKAAEATRTERQTRNKPEPSDPGVEAYRQALRLLTRRS